MKLKPTHYISVDIGPLINIEPESLPHSFEELIKELGSTPISPFIPATEGPYFGTSSSVLNDIIFCGMEKCIFVYSSEDEGLVKKEALIEPCKQEKIFADFNKSFLNSIDLRNTAAVPSLCVLPSKVEERLSARSDFLILQLLKAVNIYRILGRIEKEIFDSLYGRYLVLAFKQTKVHMSEVIYWYGHVGVLKAYIHKLCLSLLDMKHYCTKSIVSFVNSVLRIVSPSAATYMSFTLTDYFEDNWVESFMFSFLSTVYLNRTIYLESEINDQKINDCIFCLFNDPQYDKIFQLLDTKDSFEYLRAEYLDFSRKATSFEVTAKSNSLENLVTIMENLKFMPSKGIITPFFDFRKLIPV